VLVRAREQWPAPRWSIQLDPWQVSPRFGQHRPHDTARQTQQRGWPPGEDPSAGGLAHPRGAAGTA